MCVTSRLMKFLLREWNIEKLISLIKWCNNIKTWGFLIGILHSNTSVRDLRPRCLISRLDVISWSTTFDSPALLCWEQRQGVEEQRKWENPPSELNLSGQSVTVLQWFSLLVVRVGLQMLHTRTHTHNPMCTPNYNKTCHILHAWVTLYFKCIYVYYLIIFKKTCPYVVKVRAHQRLWKFFKN